MKNNAKVILFVSAILICGIALPCGANDIFYRTIQQSAVDSAKIMNATEFKVKPIDFSAIKFTDLGYAKTDEWNADLEPVPEAFSDAFVQLAEEGKMLTDEERMRGAEAPSSRYEVVMLKNDETVTSGIIVAVVVKSIAQKWNYFRKEPDEFLCDITFTDASNNQALFSATVNVTSKQATFSLGNGLFTVGPGMSFSGRIKAAAKNMALVVRTIMQGGKVEPAEKKYYGIS